MNPHLFSRFRRRVPEALTAFAALIYGAQLVGCCPAWSYQAWVPWGYVYKQGDAKHISTWALRQDDAQKIAEGFAALVELALMTDSPREAQDAGDGAVGIYNKLVRGWPGLKPAPDSAPEAQSRTQERRITGCYVSLGIFLASHKGNPRLISIFYRIRPDPTNKSRYDAWQMAGAGRLVGP